MNEFMNVAIDLSDDNFVYLMIILIKVMEDLLVLV